MAKEIAEEYTSSLADLTLNSKPLINMLTMLADDNIEHAEAIVQAVEKHLEKVRSEYKLPVLYLIDSIVKNVGRAYTQLFTQNIVNTFCSVFEKVDEKVRAQMFKLRQTWNEVFPAKKLYTLDIRVQCIDPAWPITAPSPTPSIHVNPKFFNKPATPPAVTVVPPITNPAAAVAAAAAINLDPATLDMHTQLINKQKELLELKQKKLELELLQAKAKLEEQQKQLQIHTQQVKPQATTPTQNLLLKPEVSKQLSLAGGLLGVKPTEKSSKNTHSSRSQQSIATSTPTSTPATPANNVATSGPRIAPVNSAMIAASVRPAAVRDPRLLRQQPGSGATAPSHAVSPVPQLSTHITSNNFENVNIDDKKVKSKSNNTINIDCASDKTSLNKSDNTLNRKDPRLLITNKAPGSSSLNNSNKNKSSNGRPVSSERSPNKTKTSPNNNSQSRKSSTKSNTSSSSSSSSRSFKSSGPVHNKMQADAVASSEGKSVKDSTTSILVNSNNNKGSSESSNKSSPSSPIKYRKDKKGEHINSTSDNNIKSVEQQKQQRSKISSSSKSRSRDRVDKYDDESVVSPTPPLSSSSSSGVHQVSSDQRTFKGLKGAAKNRNYMRRNRAVSISPEPSQDVDLRVCAPPEKQPRLHQSTTTDPQQQQQQSEEITKSTTLDDNSSVNKDVDLRTLVPLAINKKRSSTEKLEASNAKKSKSQMFDVLFGNEDVDLRQLPPAITTVTPPVVKRPPTPPPPIISTISEKPESKQKGKPTPADKTEWNAIRAKLAKATKKSSLDEIRSQLSEDTDMRKKPLIFGSNSGEKIIISKDDEQKIKEGNLSQALVEKVLTLFETQKLQEAQRRESEEFKTSNTGNVTLQPISDDELSVDFSHSDSDDDPKPTSARKSDLFGDRDERVPPPAPVISNNSKDQNNPVEQQKDSKPNHMDTRMLNNPRLAQNVEHGWHHRRRKMIKSHWDSPPQHHNTPEPWIRPPPAVLNQALYGTVPRRPFAPFMRPQLDNFASRMETAVPPHVLETNRTSSPPTIGSQNTRELPPADPLVLEYIDKDTMRAINIDGRLREIRYYDETAIAIMSWDDPREITFQNGTRHVTFDDKESYMLSFNDVYKDVTIAGKAHRIRLGAPTRELYIDGKWYECFFGGPGIGIEIDGKICVVKLDGPPPHVKIGSVKRNDLVAGKISLIINARTMIPIFLDAKPQKFDIEGKLHTLRFVDALRTVLINEVPFKVEFGGLPKPITVHDKKHFIRFSILPKGIKPGYVKIANMEGQRFPTPPRNDENSNDAIIVENVTAAPVSVNEPALPMLGKRKMRSNQGENSPDRNSPVMQNSSLQSLGSLDVLSSIMTSPSVMTSSTNVSGYQVEATQDSQDGFPVVNKQNNEIPGLTNTEQPAAAPPSIPFLAANFNINELFEILVTTGIITTEPTQKVPPSKDDDSYIKPVLFSQPETLKVRQQNIITTLYSGMQCSSCGVRFPPEHSMQYSQHLDWHFRQNRRGRNSARKALCRKWYYEVSDWKNYEEIEDIEEREKNWFESQQQQQQAEGQGEDGEEEIEIPSVTADSNSQETCCEVCHDKFEQFYNEEKEEWHLRMAIRVDEKTYHPLCYEDHKASLLQQHHASVSESEENKENEVEIEAETETTKIEEVEEKMEVSEEAIKEEDKVPEEEIKTEDKPENDVKIDDDEVIIQEPKIEQIIIDDNLDDDIEEEDIKTEYPAIKIKEEPMDDTDICITNIKTEPLDPEIEEIVNSVIPADTTSAEILTSIDGNVQLNTDTPISVANTIPGKIKINITKPILAPKETTNTTATESELSVEALKDSNEPLPPGEEPVQLNLKPALQGLTLTKQTPVLKGSELTGLCSIM